MDSNNEAEEALQAAVAVEEDTRGAVPLEEEVVAEVVQAAAVLVSLSGYAPASGVGAGSVGFTV